MPTDAQKLELSKLNSAIVCVRDFGVKTHVECNAAILAAAEKYFEILKIRLHGEGTKYLNAGDLYDLLGNMDADDDVYIHVNFDVPILKPKGPQTSDDYLVLYPDLEMFN